MLIIRSKFYYTASGIKTLSRWLSGAQVERGLNNVSCSPVTTCQVTVQIAVVENQNNLIMVVQFIL